MSPATSSPAAKKSSPAKVKAKKVSAPTRSHPTTAAMVHEALSTLKDRKGTSLAAIKKYIAGTHHVDATGRSSHFIGKALKAALEAQTVTLVSGTGLNGRFKLAVKEKEKKPKAAPKAKAAVASKQAKKSPKPKKPATKKSVKPSKAPKAKKTTKPPTKPKAPKSKSAAATPKKAGRKAK